jgi:ethanolamine utilization protein EutA
MIETDAEGGRVFFSNVRRSLEEEDEIRLVTVGVDIGSSTTHMVLSRLVLERLDNRYIVSEREVTHESDVLLTPYSDADTLDAGALIMTGVAVRRRNARIIGDVFAQLAGRFVSVSAGDALETQLAAFGSGAAARSVRHGARVMNIDIGGGTSKIAVCVNGEPVDMTAIDVGARIISCDADHRIVRIEEAGYRFATEAGLSLEIGMQLNDRQLDAIVQRMADRLFEAISSSTLSPETGSLLRLDPLRNECKPDIIMFSGGVSEYIYGRQQTGFGDLGPLLARAILQRVLAWGVLVDEPDAGIRATVVGASQYTVQVSGSTIYVAPLETLPIRNVAVIRPDLPLGEDVIDPNAIAKSIHAALRRLDMQDGDRPVALCYDWQGSAFFSRLDAFCRGVALGLSAQLMNGQPLVLVGDGDIGGLVGIHLVEETKITSPIISIDGVTLKEFDFIDIGAMLETSGAVPVVIKSLVFPTSAALGRQSDAIAA